MQHYRPHFKNKTIYLNCDTPEWSKFFVFFALNFKFLGLKKLITTHYNPNGPSYKYEIDEDINNDGRINLQDAKKTDLFGNGDFRSEECLAILEECDLVVTNPPFSLFREFVATLDKYGKEFLIIGNMNAISYKEIFKLIKENKLWLGVSPRGMNFRLPDNSLKNVNACWFTNLEHSRRKQEIILWKDFNENYFERYDNYDAINVDKVTEIPRNYTGAMGVPITFLDKYNPNQFEILGCDYDVKDGLLPQLINKKWNGKFDRGYIKGKRLYSRLLIKAKNLP